MSHIPRAGEATQLKLLLDEFPVVALLGSRQVGKSTLARELDPSVVFDLEDPRHVARLADPMLALEPLRGLVVIDEVQRRPELFPALRVLADRRPSPARFLLLGSASPELLRQSAESLAGRIAFQVLHGLALDEVGVEARDRLWVRGGYPRSFLAASDAASLRWRQPFLTTYLERDLPQLGIRIPADTLGRFWRMLAHYHGQTWNGSELARAFGVSDKTVRGYLDVLVATYLVHVVPPWHENIAKREVKAPKVYLTDTGLLHALLGITTLDDLRGHPKLGASFEGFAIREVTRRLGARADERYFWALHSGAELDLLVVRGRERRGFEVKHTDSPRVTASMRAAKEALKLGSVDVIYNGRETFPLAPGFRAVGIDRVGTDLAPLGA